ncbi:MAG: hypothetical protein ABR911_08555 [Syntrophales bacterium]|jgi:hypothetical protein
MSPFLSKFFSKLCRKKSPKSVSPEKKIVMDGQGTINFVNGAKYVGQFRNDEYHGQGTLTIPTGEKYVGEWKDGKFMEVN